MKIASIGLGVLLIACAVIISLRWQTKRTLEMNDRSVLAALNAKYGVQHSLAALRGWILLGDASFVEQRRDAWVSEIEPAMEQLASASIDWQDVNDQQRLQTTMHHLRELKKTQWWIEDVAQSFGNQPAQVLMRRELDPISNDVDQSTLWLIQLVRDREASTKSIIAIEQLSTFRYHFTACQQRIGSIVDSGRESDAFEFQKSLDLAQQSLDAFDASILPPVGHAVLQGVRDRLPVFSNVATEVIEARSANDSDVALNLLVEESMPHANNASRLLSEIAVRKSEELHRGAEQIVNGANFAVLVACALFFWLLVSAVIISRRSTLQLVEPIIIISKGMDLFAAGELHEDLPIISEDELGALARNFNLMRMEVDAQHRATLETNEKLRRFEQRFRATVDSAPAAMVMINIAGEIVLVNAETEKLFGYSRDELLGKPVELLVPKRFRDAHPANRTRFFGAPTARPMGAQRDVFGCRKDGSEVAIELGLNPVETEEGFFVLAAIVDITERKQLESNLLQANRALEQNNEELEQFAYIASHDLQEPLRKIASYCQLLKEEQGSKLDSDGIDYLDVAINGAERLRTLIRDLLAFSRITTRGLPVTVTDPNSCLQAALENLEITIKESGAQITVEKFPLVVSEVSQLMLLFQNLVGNAIKYRKAAPPQIHVGGRQCGDEFEFSIKDTGIGIDERFFEKVFVIFQRLHNRREYSGTGIGLAVCKRIVQRSGGRIWVTSTMGEGSTFYFTLPTASMQESSHDDNAKLCAAVASH